MEGESHSLATLLTNWLVTADFDSIGEAHLAFLSYLVELGIEVEISKNAFDAKRKRHGLQLWPGS